MQKILVCVRTLQFFTFFPAIYSTYNGSARKKSSRIFLMCACADYSVAIFPGKYVHIYYGRAAQNDMEA